MLRRSEEVNPQPVRRSSSEGGAMACRLFGLVYGFSGPPVDMPSGRPVLLDLQGVKERQQLPAVRRNGAAARRLPLTVSDGRERQQGENDYALQPVMFRRAPLH